MRLEGSWRTRVNRDDCVACGDCVACVACEDFDEVRAAAGFRSPAIATRTAHFTLMDGAPDFRARIMKSDTDNVADELTTELHMHDFPRATEAREWIGEGGVDANDLLRSNRLRNRLWKFDPQPRTRLTDVENIGRSDRCLSFPRDEKDLGARRKVERHGKPVALTPLHVLEHWRNRHANAHATNLAICTLPCTQYARFADLKAGLGIDADEDARAHFGCSSPACGQLDDDSITLQRLDRALIRRCAALDFRVAEPHPRTALDSSLEDRPHRARIDLFLAEHVGELSKPDEHVVVSASRDALSTPARDSVAIDRVC